jgi:hypothetical protein
MALLARHFKPPADLADDGLRALTHCRSRRIWPSHLPLCRNLNPFAGTPLKDRLMGAAAWLVPDSHTFFDARFSCRELKRFVRIDLD